MYFKIATTTITNLRRRKLRHREVNSSSYLVTKRKLKPRRSDFGVSILLLPFLPSTLAFRSDLINAALYSDFFFHSVQRKSRHRKHAFLDPYHIFLIWPQDETILCVAITPSHHLHLQTWLQSLAKLHWTKQNAKSSKLYWVLLTYVPGQTIFLGSKITADGDCSHKIKRCLLLGRKVMTILDSILKSRDITLLTKVHIIKAMFFPVVM